VNWRAAHRVPDTLVRKLAAQLPGVRHLLIERGSLQRPTRHLSCPAPIPAEGSSAARQPWCRVGESLAQDWQILGVDPEVAQEHSESRVNGHASTLPQWCKQFKTPDSPLPPRGSRRLEQDFFRLVSNVSQSVAAQRAPAFWLLLGDSDNRVLDTLVRGLLTLW